MYVCVFIKKTLCFWKRTAFPPSRYKDGCTHTNTLWFCPVLQSSLWLSHKVTCAGWRVPCWCWCDRCSHQTDWRSNREAKQQAKATQTRAQRHGNQAPRRQGVMAMEAGDCDEPVKDKRTRAVSTNNTVNNGTWFLGVFVVARTLCGFCVF